MKAHGNTLQERVLWMGMFTPNSEGRIGLPYVLVGEPGVGKTSLVKRLAREAGLAFEGVIASLRMPTDFLGMPVPSSIPITQHNNHLAMNGETDITVMDYAPAGFALRAAMAQHSVIFFDEFSTAPPTVQAAMLRIILEGMIGDLELPPTVRMILAMNDIEDSPGGWEIAPAMANRLGWISWESPTTEQFTTYLGASGGIGAKGVPCKPINPAIEEAAVKAEWPNAWAKAVGDVSGFLRSRPELLHNKPKGEGGQRAWCSPRSWDMAAHALAGCSIYELDIMHQQVAVAAWIGLEAWTEFLSWRTQADLPDPQEVLDEVVAFTHNPARLDKTFAVLTSCSSLLLSSHDKRKKRADVLWGMIQKICVTAPDVCLTTITELCKAQFMFSSPVAFAVLASVQPMLEVAGIGK